MIEITYVTKKTERSLVKDTCIENKIKERYCNAADQPSAVEIECSGECLEDEHGLGYCNATDGEAEENFTFSYSEEEPVFKWLGSGCPADKFIVKTDFFSNICAKVKRSDGKEVVWDGSSVESSSRVCNSNRAITQYGGDISCARMEVDGEELTWSGQQKRDQCEQGEIGVGEQGGLLCGKIVTS